MGHCVLFPVLDLMLNVVCENMKKTQRAETKSSLQMYANKNAKSEMQLCTSLSLNFCYKLLNNNRNTCGFAW